MCFFIVSLYLAYAFGIDLSLSHMCQLAVNDGHKSIIFLRTRAESNLQQCVRIAVFVYFALHTHTISTTFFFANAIRISNRKHTTKGIKGQVRLGCVGQIEGIKDGNKGRGRVHLLSENVRFVYVAHWRKVVYHLFLPSSSGQRGHILAEQRAKRVEVYIAHEQHFKACGIGKAFAIELHNALIVHLIQAF